MLIKRTVINQTEINAFGTIQIRLAKELYNDETQQTELLGLHRTSVGLNGDLEAQIKVVQAHLESMGFQPPSTDEWNIVRKLAVCAWEHIAKKQ